MAAAQAKIREGFADRTAVTRFVERAEEESPYQTGNVAMLHQALTATEKDAEKRGITLTDTAAIIGERADEQAIIDTARSLKMLGGLLSVAEGFWLGDLYNALPHRQAVRRRFREAFAGQSTGGAMKKADRVIPEWARIAKRIPREYRRFDCKKYVIENLARMPDAERMRYLHEIAERGVSPSIVRQIMEPPDAPRTESASSDYHPPCDKSALKQQESCIHEISRISDAHLFNTAEPEPTPPARETYVVGLLPDTIAGLHRNAAAAGMSEAAFLEWVVSLIDAGKIVLPDLSQAGPTPEPLQIPVVHESEKPLEGLVPITLDEFTQRGGQVYIPDVGWSHAIVNGQAFIEGVGYPIDLSNLYVRETQIPEGPSP